MEIEKVEVEHDHTDGSCCEKAAFEITVVEDPGYTGPLVVKPEHNFDADDSCCNKAVSDVALDQCPEKKNLLAATHAHHHDDKAIYDVTVVKGPSYKNPLEPMPEHQDDVDEKCCKKEVTVVKGPGYISPLAAMKAPREKIAYVTCIQIDKTKPDYLATIDIDPESPTFLQVIHRLKVLHNNEELHHSGWNACSSCHDCPSVSRDKLILPCFMSDRIYVVDLSEDPRAPKIHKVVEPEELHALDVATPHTSHCLPSGEVMIVTMGKKDGSAKGSFVMLDAENDYKVKGTFSKDTTKFGYDFWYQPYHNVMISSQWGTPACIKEGFKTIDLEMGHYGQELNIWDWTERKLIQTLDLGKDGLVPSEIRFLHNPLEAQGYVICGIYSKLFHFYKKPCGEWTAEAVVTVPQKKVEGWIMPEMGSNITDMVISMDDKFCYFGNWFHGDIRQYDITDRDHPKLVGQVWVGGCITRDGPVKVIEDSELTEQPEPLYVKGRRITGGPQMLQLSLDGKRLYFTNSLITPWDKQFHPEMIETGSVMLQIDVNTETGGLTVNPDFLVDFGLEPDGPVLAHEIRYPGGDCTSDIYVAN